MGNIAKKARTRLEARIAGWPTSGKSPKGMTMHKPGSQKKNR